MSSAMFKASMKASTGPQVPWLRQLLCAAELGEHYEKAALWVEEEGCVRSDLDTDECLEELIEHLALKRFQVKRIRKACDTCTRETADEDQCASTVSGTSACPSTVDDAEFPCQAAVPSPEAETAVEGMSVEAETAPEGMSVEAEAVEAETVTAAEGVSVEAVISEAEAVISEADTYLSRLKAAAPSPRQVVQNSKQKVVRSIETDSNAAAPSQGVVQSTESRKSAWTVRKQTLKKDRATRDIPSDKVGLIIGSKGSTIKEIERACGVSSVRVEESESDAAATVVVLGRPETIESAKTHIDNILSRSDRGPKAPSSEQKVVQSNEKSSRPSKPSSEEKAPRRVLAPIPEEAAPQASRKNSTVSAPSSMEETPQASRKNSTVSAPSSVEKTPQASKNDSKVSMPSSGRDCSSASGAPPKGLVLQPSPAKKQEDRVGQVAKHVWQKPLQTERGRAQADRVGQVAIWQKPLRQWSSVKVTDCKSYADREIPSKRASWIIGPKGSRIKEMEREFSVVVTVPKVEDGKEKELSTVSVMGEHDNVKSAMEHIDSIVFPPKPKPSERTLGNFKHF